MIASTQQNNSKTANKKAVNTGVMAKVAAMMAVPIKKCLS
jgi:hypothetical protein